MYLFDKTFTLSIDGYIYIYGTGSCGTYLYDFLKQKGYTKVRGFIDRIKLKNGQLAPDNHKVLSKEEFLRDDSKKKSLVIIASSGWNDIYPEFIKAGFDNIVLFPFPGFEKMDSVNCITWNHPYALDQNFKREGYVREKQLRTHIAKVISNTMVTLDGLLSLADQVRYLEKQKTLGDFVEMGCCNGGAVGLMAAINLECAGRRRQLHAFDSFEGLPQPTKSKDNSQEMIENWDISTEEHQGKLHAVGKLVAQEENVRDLVINKISYPEEFLNIHTGWFQETLPQAVQSIDKVAILRLDGDLYESTYVALEYLYPKLVKGGFLILDDWCLEGARKAVSDYFQKNDIHLYRNRVDYTVCYWENL